MRVTSLLACLLVGLAVGGVMSESPVVAQHNVIPQAHFNPMDMISGLMGMMGGGGGGAGGGMGDILGMFMNMAKGWFSMIQGLMGSMMGGGGGGAMGKIFTQMLDIGKSGFDKALGAMNSAGLGNKAQITNMYSKTQTVLVSTLKSKLTNKQKVQHELDAIKKIMETKHANPQQLVRALKTKAPQVSSAVQTAYSRALQEYNKHFKALKPEAKKSAQQVHLHAIHAHNEITDMLGPLLGMMGGGGGNGGSEPSMASMMSTMMKVFENFSNIIKMILPLK